MIVTRSWRKSSYSANQSECVEVRTGDIVGVRDTKSRRLGQLAVPAAAWLAFTDALKAEEAISRLELTT
jgi:Domain of unknown function (DUF397)